MDLAQLETAAAGCRGAGFTAAAAALDVKIDRARKLAVAYEFHRYVTADQVVSFNSKLWASTKRVPNPIEAQAAAYRMYGQYGYDMSSHIKEIRDQLVFDDLAAYAGCPPVDVLEAVKVARARECFDGFAVAHVSPIATQVVLPDPIVFGSVEGCTDLFFIAEWGEDVKVSDLIGAHQG